MYSKMQQSKQRVTGEAAIEGLSKKCQAIGRNVSSHPTSRNCIGKKSIPQADQSTQRKEVALFKIIGYAFVII